ncbi:MAG: hypothetical protein V5B33_16170 [Candidatus Accumulibacter sp. UW20]
MGHVVPTTVISHWNHRIEGMQQSSNDFYAEVEGLIKDESVEGVKIERVNISEGGLFSSKREYLQIRRGEHVFHVCAAPFGTGFFLSSWLGIRESGFWAWLSDLPLVGGLVQNFLKPLTYYKIDTALMFQSIAHAAVLRVLDDLTATKGIQALTESERKPIMRDFFSRLGGSSS